uniref:Uncharacterized protein n=1 Tax=Anopheles atroparvus TaxID=41427 RepID=A0AAG5DP71_ANOAO
MYTVGCGDADQYDAQRPGHPPLASAWNDCTLTFRSFFVYDELLCAFKQISPNLETLKLTFSSFEHLGKQLLRFPAQLRTTLEAITLSYTKVNRAILQQIGSIESLRLRKVSLSERLFRKGPHPADDLVS